MVHPEVLLQPHFIWITENQPRLLADESKADGFRISLPDDTLYCFHEKFTVGQRARSLTLGHWYSSPFLLTLIAIRRPNIIPGINERPNCRPVKGI